MKIIIALSIALLSAGFFSSCVSRTVVTTRPAVRPAPAKVVVVKRPVVRPVRGRRVVVIR